jgi:hypothetical protein
MKWLLRIPVALLLLSVLALAGAWLAFPWYAQSLIDRITAGKGIVLKLRDAGRPGLSGIGFGRIDAVVTTPPDTCTGIRATYHASLFNGHISWRSLPSAGKTVAGIVLVADSVEVLQKPANIIFRDLRPIVGARLDFRRSRGIMPDISPDSVTYAVDSARIETGRLRLDGVSYRALLARSHNWVQQPSRFRAESLSSDGLKMPLTGFEATFGIARNHDKPCTLTFTDCSVDLFGIRASTPEIDYSLRKKQTSFVLVLDSVPLGRIAELAALRGGNPVLSGVLSGSIPVEYLDSTLRVKNGTIDAASGSLLAFRDAGGKQLLSFDAGRRRGGAPLVGGLNAEVTLDAKNGKLSTIRLNGLSSRVFSGSVTMAPTAYDMETGSAECIVRLKEVPLLDRIRLNGQFTGTLKGSVSGKIPVSLNRGRIALRNASLFSKGGGTLRQSTPKKTASFESSITGSDGQILWGFSEPSVVLDRNPLGRTTILFNMKSLSRRSGGGEMALSGAKGTIIYEEAGKPARISLNGFSAGIFDGTISIDRVDYDLQTRHAETIVQLNGIPLQKLLDLQGVKKIFATGSVRGRVPVVLDGDSFSIPDGGMDSERSGQIIYSSTPEERATANAGMRMTYEALGNFLYSSLISSITMTPDGNSRITLQLKGHNPDFQDGRPVNLNLNIEQNLLDLFRSLAISSGIEEAISEKALQQRKKR